jgi:hypothetical protein
MFDSKKTKRWRRDIWRIFEAQGFKAMEIMPAMVMAAVAEFGTDPSVLAEITALSTDYVKKVLKRLRRQRILVGQTMRTRWDETLAAELDAMAAAGLITRRFVDPKRSAAQKARAPETRARGPRRKRATVLPGAVFTPKVQKADPLYGLPEWEK